MLAYLRTMPLVHPTLGVRTVYRIRVYDVQVEADIGGSPDSWNKSSRMVMFRLLPLRKKGR